jgi:hypothetical protein
MPDLKALMFAIMLALPGVALAQMAPIPSAPTDYSEHNPMFAEPFIDVDTLRDAPVRHRYIHGGFRGTDLRFFQYVTPVPDRENLAQGAGGEEDSISFSVESGAYFLETNGGGYRTLGSVENTRGLSDGAVPFVIGSPMAAPNVFSVRMHAMRVIGDRFDGIVDALEPGAHSAQCWLFGRRPHHLIRRSCGAMAGAARGQR